MSYKNNSKPLMSLSEVARDLGMAQNTVRQWANSGALPPVLGGRGRERWARADIERVKGGVFAQPHDAAVEGVQP